VRGVTKRPIVTIGGRGPKAALREATEEKRIRKASNLELLKKIKGPRHIYRLKGGDRNQGGALRRKVTALKGLKPGTGLGGKKLSRVARRRCFAQACRPYSKSWTRVGQREKIRDGKGGLPRGMKQASATGKKEL